MMVRYAAPSKLDMAPYHALCKVHTKHDTVEIYLQISHDEEDPNWIPYGEFAHPVSDEHIQSTIFKNLLHKQ